MKKLITAFLLLLSMNTQAEVGPYFKFSAGVNQSRDQKVTQGEYVGKLKLRRFFPVMGIGGGYEFDNGLRIESLFDYYFQFTHQENGKLHDTRFNLNLDTRITDLVVNIHQSFPVNEDVNGFIGGGCGISSIKDEGTGLARESDGKVSVLAPSYGRHVYRFTYRFTGGIEYDLRKGIRAELSYNYLHLGKNKPQLINGGPSITPRQFRVHNMTFGIRYNI